MLKKLTDLEEKRENDGIPVGYKKSEGYLIPEEWNLVQFKDLFNRLIRKNKENNQNVLTISAQQGLISQMDYYNTLYASENKLGYSLLHKGDFSYNKSYSGDYAYGAIKRLEAYDKGIVSPLYICFEAKEGTNAEFYNQYFESGMFNREIYKIAQEGARNHGLLNVSTDDFFDSILVFPSEEEQKKIAEILHQCDKIIGLKKELIKVEKNKKKWLIEKFMNLGTTVEFKNCCLNKGEYGVNAPACEYQPELPQYIRITDIDDNGKYVKNCPVSVMTQEKEKYTLHEGDILFVRTGGTVGKPYRYVASDGELVFAGFLIRFSVNTCLFDDKFIYYQFLTSRYRNWVSTMSARSGQPGINAEEYGKYLLMLPSTIEEQRKIANIISAEDEVIAKMEKELLQWKQKKKSLMQLLLTGIVRVNV